MKFTESGITVESERWQWVVRASGRAEYHTSLGALIRRVAPVCPTTANMLHQLSEELDDALRGIPVDIAHLDDGDWYTAQVPGNVVLYRRQKRFANEEGYYRDRRSAWQGYLQVALRLSETPDDAIASIRRITGVA